MKMLSLILVLLLLLPVVHPCRGSVACGDEATTVAACHEEKDTCCAAEEEQPADHSHEHDDCADECLGYCCATVVTPPVPAPVLAEYTILQTCGVYEPTLRFYDVTHLIWQPPKRG